jgi:hypothetical protein
MDPFMKHGRIQGGSQGAREPPLQLRFIKINGSDLLNFLLMNSRLLHNISAVH